MSDQTEARNTSTIELDLEQARHLVMNGKNPQVQALGALVAASLLIHDLDWCEFRRNAACQEYAALYLRLMDDIGNAIEAGVGLSDFDDDDGGAL